MTAFVEYKFEFLLLINVREKETLAQVFSCEFCEICKNTFSYRTPQMADSEMEEIQVDLKADSSAKMYY